MIAQKTTLLFKQIAGKTIVWSKNKNQYIILENKTATILKDIHQGKTISVIADELVSELLLPKSEIEKFIRNLEKDFFLSDNKKPVLTIDQSQKIKKPKEYQYTKKYSINNYIFEVEYQTEEELYYVHPKFAHLEIENSAKPDFYYCVFTQEKLTYLFVDEIFIGAWLSNEIHYFQGKFSMQLVQDIHQKVEEKWLGVFHASAVSDGKNAMLFLGDSGNGKSTSLALLQANGFTCLADDFVPIDAKKQEVYSFPSAISIKKNSLKTLLPYYPELKSSAEYHFKRLNKIVRYLPPNNANYTAHLPCKALIFIKYDPSKIVEINKISKVQAFEKLVPDSWLSPIKENAKTFLDWFSRLPCYELMYADTDKMIATVSKLFRDEL